MRKLITLDVGTTAVKVGLFNEKLEMLKVIIREYSLETPGAGLVELNPDVYWDNVVAGIRQILKETDTKAEEVVSITATTQGETLIPLDENGAVLHNAVVWLDSRAQEEAEFVASKIEPLEFYAKTGVPEVNGYCPIAKLLWFKNKRPEVYQKAYKFLLLEDFLVYKLTGKCVTNPGLMCTTGYFDIQRNCIWDEILDSCGLDSKKIPEVLPCGVKVAAVSPGAAEELGLTGQTVVTTGAMDQVTGAVGSGNISEGMVSETTGTAMVIAASTANPKLDQLSTVNVYSHAVPGLYLNISMLQTAGVLLKWFRDELCKDLPKDEAFNLMSDLAGNVPPLSRGLFLYPHYTGIQEPVSDDNARGVFFGLGLDTGRDCMIRALFEGVGYAMRENLEFMGLEPDRLVSLGGGSKSDVWCQIKSDICSVPVDVPMVTEAASLGAAILGGVACGIFKDIQEPLGLLSMKKSYSPSAENHEIYEDGYRKYKMMYQTFAPLFGKEKK